MGAECCRPEGNSFPAEHEPTKDPHEVRPAFDRFAQMQESYSAQVDSSTAKSILEAEGLLGGDFREAGSPASANQFCGVWRVGSGGEVTVNLLSGMLEITNSHKPKQLLNPQRVLRDGKFQYFGALGTPSGNRITWSDGATWTRKEAPPQMPPIQEPTLACIRPTRPINAESWATIGAPSLRKKEGKWYFEVRLGSVTMPQVGWVTESFRPSEEQDAAGVGDDEHGWSVDGIRGKKRHGGTIEDQAWPASWRKNGVVGCALDIDAGRMEFSYNGKWEPAACFDFEAGGRSFYPAVSSDGLFRMIFTVRAFRFAPPDLSYGILVDTEDGEFPRPVSLQG